METLEDIDNVRIINNSYVLVKVNYIIRQNSDKRNMAGVHVNSLIFMHYYTLITVNNNYILISFSD